MIKKYTTIALSSLLLLQNICAATDSFQPKATPTTVKQKPSVTKQVMKATACILVSLGACWVIRASLQGQIRGTKYLIKNDIRLNEYIAWTAKTSVVLLGCYEILAKYPRKVLDMCTQTNDKETKKHEYGL